jgi:hypothetical protein
MNAIENLIFENSHKCQEKYIWEDERWGRP